MKCTIHDTNRTHYDFSKKFFNINHKVFPDRLVKEHVVPKIGSQNEVDFLFVFSKHGRRES